MKILLLSLALLVSGGFANRCIESGGLAFDSAGVTWASITKDVAGVQTYKLIKDGTLDRTATTASAFPSSVVPLDGFDCSIIPDHAAGSGEKTYCLGTKGDTWAACEMTAAGCTNPSTGSLTGIFGSEWTSVDDVAFARPKSLYCSVTHETSCTANDQCPTGETCDHEPVYVLVVKGENWKYCSIVQNSQGSPVCEGGGQIGTVNSIEPGWTTVDAIGADFKPDMPGDMVFALIKGDDIYVYEVVGGSRSRTSTLKLSTFAADWCTTAGADVAGTSTSFSAAAGNPSPGPAPAATAPAATVALAPWVALFTLLVALYIH